jgi:methylglyoxal synthase
MESRHPKALDAKALGRR